MEVRTRKATDPKPLDIKSPFSTRSQPLKLLARTVDNKLVLQGLVNHQVITTDMFGRRLLQNGRPAETQTVYNAASPDQCPGSSDRVKVDYKIGDLVYCLRPLSKACKVHVGMVEGFIAGGSTEVRLADESRKWMATRDGQSRKDVIKTPNSIVFKSAAKIREFLDQFDSDLERAAKLFDDLSGTRS